jgi:hypothetical protein
VSAYPPIAEVTVSHARILLCLLALLLTALLSAPVASGPGTAVGKHALDKDWAYTRPVNSPLPVVKHAGWIINPIDAFILARLEEAELSPSAPADKLTLLRRVTFDLTGLPPTLAEQNAFMADASPGAYERVVDRLLRSPRYGEKWAQHWLDLVRYAETDGFKADDHRPNAFRYRDYVINAFNTDLPYDRFVQEQLAGDEIALGSSLLALGGSGKARDTLEEPRAKSKEPLIATGYLRLMPDEYNAANLEQRRQEILDDVTEVTSLAFLGLTLGCAKCHDHKFDPLLQTDFYRLQAYFAATKASDEHVLADAEARREHAQRMREWEEATQPLRTEMDTLLAGKREEMRKQALEKFRAEIQQAVLTKERTPYQQQIAAMAEKQMALAEKDAPTKMAADKKKRYQELEQQMAKLAPRPAELPSIMAITDVGPVAPPTHLLSGGDWRKPEKELQPGVPLIFSEASGGRKPSEEAREGATGSLGRLTLSARQGATTGRRSVLAAWLTHPEHPLTARVMVNRLWHHHFGRGIVATPNDFGKQGDPPTHPELLDWLAVEFVERGWSLKHMHRLMVTSATYRQSSALGSLLFALGAGAKHASDPQEPRAKSREQLPQADPENELLWRMRRHRLDGEALRDAMLAISGELNLRMAGPSAKPKLPDKISSYAWKPDAKPEDQHRRSVYVLTKRNMRYPLFDAFDLPDMHNSCACRQKTITAPQALMMLNGELTLERAAAWANSLHLKHGDDHRSLVTEAIRTAWCRPPQDEEIELATRFIEKQAGLVGGVEAAVADFCHALLNANEFVWVD